MDENEIKMMLMRCAQIWPDVEDKFMELEETLTPREGGVIMRMYGLGFPPHTRKELAAHFKISKERLEQVRHKAFRKIGHPGRAEIVAQLLSACALPMMSGTMTRGENENLEDR